MKILYGVVGEGLGHAMRSRVILDHLTSQGHDVHVMASDRACAYLAKRFENVRRIHGLHIIAEENRVRPMRTLWSNVRRGLVALPHNLAAYFDLLREFKPERVISDFESWTYWYGKLHEVPVLSIDNMQIINRCVMPDDVTEGHRMAYFSTKAFIRSKLPGCSQYFVTTFFAPEIEKERTTLFPPILRPEILEALPTVRRDDHLLVYTTAEGNEQLVESLRASGLDYRIYGLKRNLTADERDGNLTYRPFNEATFIDDMASCRAVIAGGGFTAMGEAIAMGKPMLSIPIRGQFEQLVNARFLQKEGFGLAAETVDSDALTRFLMGTPVFGATLRNANFGRHGNTALFAAVDRWLEEPTAY